VLEAAGIGGRGERLLDRRAGARVRRRPFLEVEEQVRRARHLARPPERARELERAARAAAAARALAGEPPRFGAVEREREATLRVAAGDPLQSLARLPVGQRR